MGWRLISPGGPKCVRANRNWVACNECCSAWIAKGGAGVGGGFRVLAGVLVLDEGKGGTRSSYLRELCNTKSTHMGGDGRYGWFALFGFSTQG